MKNRLKVLRAERDWNQQDLADLFGVSRMPVREALRQLEAQSLLNVVAHKGAVVAPLVQGDAVETRPHFATA